MNTLVLFNARWTIAKFFIDNVRLSDVQVKGIYRLNRKSVLYSLAALHIEKLNLPLQSIWYGEWKKQLNEFDTIIIYANILGPEVAMFIHKYNPRARIIFWYWDKYNSKPNNLKYKDFCEYWSFDYEDCLRYKFHYNKQFYWPLKLNAEERCAYDLVIIARDKGRYAQFIQFKKRLEAVGLITFVRIIADKTTKDKRAPYIGKELQYTEIVRITQRSRAIVEFVKDGQTGLTMRVMEALFYNKKLITNNGYVSSEPFYARENIYILEDVYNPKDILKFIHQPSVPIDNNVKNEYTFNSWLERFKKVAADD